MEKEKRLAWLSQLGECCSDLQGYSSECTGVARYIALAIQLLVARAQPGCFVEQEFMVAMECLFYEWYQWDVEKDKEGPLIYGRVPLTNNTEALAIVTKEGGVSSASLPLWSLAVRNALSGRTMPVRPCYRGIRVYWLSSIALILPVLALIQVQPWCIPLPESSRICHLRSNMGFDWAENVLPHYADIGGKTTDIMVRTYHSLKT
jgi:hypothetical protein